MSKTNQLCKYYNFGGDFAKGYPCYPSAYGARCEKYKAFFITKNGQLTPNCNTCKEDIMNQNVETIGTIKVCYIKTNVYKYNSQKYILAQDLIRWIEYDISGTNKIINKTNPINTIKKDIYYKGQIRKMWLVNTKGVIDILNGCKINSNFISDIIQDFENQINNVKLNPITHNPYFHKMKEIMELNQTMHDKLNDFMKMLNS